MGTISDTQRKQARSFGKALLCWRNDSKLTLELLAEKSGVALARLRELEADSASPTLDEMERLAQTLTVNLRDFFSVEIDTDRGIKWCLAEEAYERTIQRQGRPYYIYRDLVLTTEIPTMRPEILTLLCTDEKQVVLNEGHFLHQCTYGLHGNLRFFWKFDGQTYHKDFKEGDSWYIRPFVPHSFTSLDKNDLAKIIAFTFAGTVTQDAVNELAALGGAAAQRIAKENTQWFKA